MIDVKFYDTSDATESYLGTTIRIEILDRVKYTLYERLGLIRHARISVGAAVTTSIADSYFEELE